MPLPKTAGVTHAVGNRGDPRGRPYQQGQHLVSWAHAERCRDDRDPRAADLIDARRDEFRALLTKYAATYPRLFGSLARGTAHEESDIDIFPSQLLRRRGTRGADSARYPREG